MSPKGRGGVRVALFTNNYQPRISGVAIAVDFLERGLRAAGHETLVVAPRYPAFRAEGNGDDSPASAVRRVRSIPLRRVKFAIPLPHFDSPRAEVASFAPDVLHAHHPFLLGRSALAAADAMARPLVFTFHTLYEAFLGTARLDFAPIRAIVRAYVRRYVERCDLVVAPTEPVRRHLVGDLGITVPTATAPTGLDPDRFRALDSAQKPERRAALAAELGLNGHAPLLLWAGRLTDEKQPALALETLAALRERGSDAALAFLGQGPRLGLLARQAKDLGLGDRVRFAGFVSQERLPEVLSAGDAYLFTSWTDTQGIVAYEAWAAGLPIVSVPSMAGRAIVEPERNGLLAEPNGAAFAHAIEALVARPELGNAPFPWHEYDAPALAARWSRIYEDAILLGRRSRAKAGSAERTAMSPIPRAVPPLRSTEGAHALRAAREPRPIASPFASRFAPAELAAVESDLLEPEPSRARQF